MSDADGAAGAAAGGGLAATLDELYAGALGDFTARRDASAKALRGAGRTDLAARVKSARKPVVAAWVVNLLVRREAEQIDQVLELGAALRTAAADLDGEELRQLTRQRRQLTAAVTTRSRALARREGVAVSGTVADQVEGTLHAAMLSEVAARAVRTGALVRPITPAEVGDLADAPEGADLADAVADAALLGLRARPVAAEPEPTGPPALRLVADDGAARRAAEEELAEARAAAEELRAETAEAAGARDRLRARSLQLEEEIEELRRRIATLDDELDGVADELEEAEAAVESLEADLAEARRRVEEAEEAIRALD